MDVRVPFSGTGPDLVPRGKLTSSFEDCIMCYMWQFIKISCYTLAV